MWNVYYAFGIEIGYDDDDDEECMSVRATHTFYISLHISNIYLTIQFPTGIFSTCWLPAVSTPTCISEIFIIRIDTQFFPATLRSTWQPILVFLCIELQINPVSLETAS